MKFDFWTFLFQLINFIVLLFILKRLFFKPVKEMMEKRRKVIENAMQEAETIKKEAMELKEKNEEELNKLQETKIQAMDKMRSEIEVERKKLIKEAKKGTDEIIEKEKAIFDTEKKRAEAELKEKVLETVSIFSTNLFKDISDRELHESILRKMFREIDRIAPDIGKVGGKEDTIPVLLATAYPIEEEDIKKIQETLESHTSQKIAVNTRIDKTLLAGVSITAYDNVYDFSLSGQIEALKLRLHESA